MTEQDLTKKYQKRKDRIKNIAIIFLVIMLLLTFFSNTIMNYSLAEVETTYAEPGSLTTKIRGEAYVEAREPVNVSSKNEREILKVLVKDGDKVKKGQALFVLAGESSADALRQAKSDLMTLNHDYAKSLLEMAVPEYATNSLEIKYAKKDLQNSIKSVEEAKKENSKKKAKYAELKKKAENAKKKMLNKADEVSSNAYKISQADLELESLESEKAELSGENSTNIQELETAVTAAKRETEDAEDKVKQYEDSRTSKTIEEELKTKRKELDDLQKSLDTLKADLKEAETPGSADDKITTLERSIRDCKAEISTLNSKADQANAEIAELNYLYYSADDERKDQYWQQLSSAKQEYIALTKQIDDKKRELGDFEKDLETAKKSAETSSDKKIKQLKKDIISKEEDITEIKKEISSLEKEKSLSDNRESQLALAKTELYAAQKKLKNAERQLEDAQKAVKNENSTKLKSVEDKIKALKSKRLKLDNQKTKLENSYTQLQSAYETAKAEADSYQKADEDLIDTLTQAVQEKRKALETLYINLAKEKSDDSLKRQVATLDNEQKAKSIQMKKNEIARLKKKRKNHVIRAKLAGTISDLTAKAGENATPGNSLLNIQPSGNGYQISIPVTMEQSKLVKRGDNATVLNMWDDDIKVILANIKTDPQNPNAGKTLVFNVSGSNIENGTSLSISVGEKKANYDYIVPTSAIREDSDGKFVLVIQEKPSPVGNRYIAKKEEVQVLAQNETQSAISAGFDSYANVITTASKAVEKGDYVRLAQQ
ncbi:MAG: biotin/lipoyl-binding protein [Lachnospiraceae bacterium]|nr:biotin/lipoyl-binding protein [Lachnospiraceae bacterium]